MDTATESRRSAAVSVFLAGLQAGMIGTLWMLAWMGASAAWKHLSFWTSANLFATFFYGAGALQPGFSSHTVSGLALYFLMYSLLGGLLAALVGGRLPRLRLWLAGILFGVCWYYVSYRLMWRSVMPLVALLHPVRPTITGHIIYGAFVGRFPRYAPKTEPAPQAELPA